MKLSRVLRADFDSVLKFWSENDGVGTRGFESLGQLDAFLNRNPGLSFKITDGDEIVGTIMCGHDGRRGYVHHLVVKKDYPTLAIGKTLIDRGLKELRAVGIAKCHIFIAADNSGCVEFWRSIAWDESGGLKLFSHDIEYPAT